jgi:ABC-2 type transport system permease protein
MRPKLLTALNRWKRRDQMKTHWLRNIALLSIAIFLMFAAYHGGYWVLEQTNSVLDFAYLHSSTFLGLILVFLLVILTVTNCATTLGNFYLGKDLGLVVAAPVSPARFFFGKLLETTVFSSWMTAVFILPVILLFGRYYNASALYYVMSLVVFLPFFLIPSSFAVLICALLARFFPANRKRELFAIALIVVLYGLYFIGDELGRGMSRSGTIDVTDIFRVVSFLSIANRYWSPSHWVAYTLGELLEPTGAGYYLHLSLLYCVTLTLVAAAYLAVRLLHFDGFSRASLSTQGKVFDSRRSHHIWAKILSPLSKQSRALVVKECKSAVRDVPQLVQIVLLLGLCGLYLYTLSFQHVLQEIVPAGKQKWWKFFLISTNLCVESFVITAMGTRLVYPSVSREGRAFWILQTSPLSYRELLEVKFRTWLTIVLFVTSLVFGFAAYLLYSSMLVVILKICMNAVICFGLVGLGVGFGSYFADFEWQHPSQLIAGFGTLIYMLVGVGLIATNLILGSTTMYLGVVKGGFQPAQYPNIALLTALMALFVILANVFVSRLALHIGARSLENRA